MTSVTQKIRHWTRGVLRGKYSLRRPLLPMTLHFYSRASWMFAGLLGPEVETGALCTFLPKRDTAAMPRVCPLIFPQLNDPPPPAPLRNDHMFQQSAPGQTALLLTLLVSPRSCPTTSPGPKVKWRFFAFEHGLATARWSRRETGRYRRGRGGITCLGVNQVLSLLVDGRGQQGQSSDGPWRSCLVVTVHLPH